MASKSKGPREKIMLQSTGTNEKGELTKYSYTTYKNKRNTPSKIEIKKFDPRAYNTATQKYGMQVVFKEKKIPK